jgi:hypothetical protein
MVLTAVFQVRSEFDHLLMNHARSSGAPVYEQTKVTSISFSSVGPKRPVSVSWSHIPPRPPSLLRPLRPRLLRPYSPASQRHTSLLSLGQTFSAVKVRWRGGGFGAGTGLTFRCFRWDFSALSVLGEILDGGWWMYWIGSRCVARRSTLSFADRWPF